MILKWANLHNEYFYFCNFKYMLMLILFYFYFCDKVFLHSGTSIFTEVQHLNTSTTSAFTFVLLLKFDFECIIFHCKKVFLNDNGATFTLKKIWTFPSL